MIGNNAVNDQSRMAPDERIHPYGRILNSSPIPIPAGVTPTARVVPYPGVVRLHVNNACNLRCSYPSSGKPLCYMSRDNFSDSVDNEKAFLASARILGEMTGITAVRIGGKEPGLHPRLPHIVEQLLEFGFKKIKITTNATAIGRHVGVLAALGIAGVTVSLQTISRDMYRTVTGVDGLAQALASIDAMRAHDIPVKISRILMRETTGDIDTFLSWAYERNLTVKFYELMKLPGHDAEFENSFMPIRGILHRYKSDMVAADCVFYSISCKSVWNYSWEDGSRLEVKAMHADILAKSADCSGCPYIPYCDTGYLGCGFQVLSDGAVRPCLLDGRHDIKHNPHHDGAFIENVRSMIEASFQNHTHCGDSHE